eukprot:CAMPEP_0180241480 /NCGR_PEP_ID=MMETSP0987-20121128/32697_1 /TAXON_ID=697907 /ORGANISM="non described non described, Strain CCMP2293" /LENGTH=169 /DNA_ID=CAMNT_0022208499 /DNA_START=73 /DNA_END=578 /DNA_ORIENTATION=+
MPAGKYTENAPANVFTFGYAGCSDIWTYDADSHVDLFAWRGHNHAVRALAIVPGRYLVSLSESDGSEMFQEIIVWNLRHPGQAFWQCKPNIAHMHGVAIRGSNLMVFGDTWTEDSQVKVFDLKSASSGEVPSRAVSVRRALGAQSCEAEGCDQMTTFAAAGDIIAITRA